MATIYEKTPGALIAAPGRTVATFPTGLLRVDQTYICTTASAASHRASLVVGGPVPDGNTVPSNDGLFISPQPQEVERGDGFTEFKVSAYGRTAPNLQSLTLTTKRMSFTRYHEIGTAPNFSLTSSQYLRAAVFLASGTICLMEGEDLSQKIGELGGIDDFLMPFDMNFINFDGESDGRSVYGGTTMTKPGTYQQYWNNEEMTLPLVLQFSISDPVYTITSRTTFGKFTEVTFTSDRFPTPKDQLTANNPDNTSAGRLFVTGVGIGVDQYNGAVWPPPLWS